MKNLASGMEQMTPKYNINPSNFRIEIYISFDKTVVITAEKDNNYTEWLSIGKLSSNDNSVGQCINYLLRHTPLPVCTYLTRRSMEQECLFPWALNIVSDRAITMFNVLKNKYVFSQDEEVRNLLYELFQLKSTIYNKYMTAAR
ncbi:hypothetical protein [Paenibacillus durus]|uniref:Uncharacterized protein n=1 Tax=Paenibacillus durus ATCC 35681 TaxID=1333534 RepID=A0A0F7FE26_PAEDU|nr:hypothetical protein [Paenibacillus durus]AKG37123.1 hypothetical protein VK70_23620 [Paenibacillus durus ATCC 35681]